MSPVSGSSARCLTSEQGPLRPGSELRRRPLRVFLNFRFDLRAAVNQIAQNRMKHWRYVKQVTRDHGWRFGNVLVHFLPLVEDALSRTSYRIAIGSTPGTAHGNDCAQN